MNVLNDIEIKSNSGYALVVWTLTLPILSFELKNLTQELKIIVLPSPNIRLSQINLFEPRPCPN